MCHSVLELPGEAGGMRIAISQDIGNDGGFPFALACPDSLCCGCRVCRNLLCYGEHLGCHECRRSPGAPFLAALVIRATRPPVTIKQRLIVLAISALLLTGVTGHWIVMNSMTQWQYSELQDIRKRMEYSLMVSYMYDHAAPVFAAYHRQPSAAKRSLAEVFLSQIPHLIPRPIS